jgi:hypothetical protein
VIVGAAGVWGFVSARRPDLAGASSVLRRLTRSRVVRLLLLVGWGWVGWHLFARGSGAFD